MVSLNNFFINQKIPSHKENNKQVLYAKSAVLKQTNKSLTEQNNIAFIIKYTENFEWVLAGYTPIKKYVVFFIRTCKYHMLSTEIYSTKIQNNELSSLF